MGGNSQSIPAIFINEETIGGGGGGGPVSWASVTGKPTAFAPAVHAHAMEDIALLDEELASKAAVNHTHTAANITDFNASVDARITNKTVYNQSVAQQGAGFATDTYLTGSSIAIPSGALKAGTRYHLIFDVSKTAAGTATPVITIRFGTNGTTADTARLTFTFLAQTAAADIGTFEIWVTVRSVGSGTSAVLQGTAQCRHRLSTTGLQNQPGTTLQITSGGFDSTVANSIIGASVNAGASAAWTVQLVQAELLNIN